MPPALVIIGADHAGVSLKDLLAGHLRSRGIEVVDLGPHSTASVDYPDFARAVCSAVLERGAVGVLVCGTGIGMSMTANKVPGIRAAVCALGLQARMTRLHNDANVLCLGERITGPGLAVDILDIFLDTPFEGGRHARRVDKIEAC